MGPPRPAWVAFSSHDYHGDDLRRRWDDPELRRQGTGRSCSRAPDRTPARSLPATTSSRSILRRCARSLSVLRRLQRLLAPWRHYTGSPAGFGIPFVDYARGDGFVDRPRARRGVEPGPDRR